MLNLPDKLTLESFLEKHWQKSPLFMPGALDRLRPAITRNELAWLATLDDVESRIVFVNRSNATLQYRVENGPFDEKFLNDLPKRDWTLLVHDVEKHIPAMRALFNAVPFIPDWRIDDLMVSFAAPGGGVGPHRDHYDVFLCQGIGIRDWHFSSDDVRSNPDASDDLALIHEFSGHQVEAVQGDILYIPPGVAHWGTAKRACLTYSIGMRAPQAADISFALDCPTHGRDTFYSDPDLCLEEVRSGYISPLAIRRAGAMMKLPADRHPDVAIVLGRFATQAKDWLRPDNVSADEAASMLLHWRNGGRLRLHGMSQIAYDDHNLYVNGESISLANNQDELMHELCKRRVLSTKHFANAAFARSAEWMIERGAFEIPETY